MPARCASIKENTHLNNHLTPPRTPDFLKAAAPRLIPYGTSGMLAEDYGNPAAEYAALMHGTGLIWASYRAALKVEGKDRLKFLNHLLTQDIKTMPTGAVHYSYLLNIKGRIIADMQVLALADETLLDVDTRVLAPLLQTLDRYLFADDVSLQDMSAHYTRFTLAGPQSEQALADALPECRLPLLSAVQPCAALSGWIYRTDLLGVPTWEVAVAGSRAGDFWSHLTAATAGKTATPVGWSAFNAARIQAGLPWFGIDITDQHLPMETGPAYHRAVHLSKGCYVGQEVVARMHSHKTVARALMAMEFAGPVAPSAGAPLYDGEMVVGNLTSAAPNPDRPGWFCAMGYVKKIHAVNGKVLAIQMDPADGTPTDHPAGQPADHPMDTLMDHRRRPVLLSDLAGAKN